MWGGEGEEEVEWISRFGHIFEVLDGSIDKDICHRNRAVSKGGEREGQ